MIRPPVTEIDKERLAAERHHRIEIVRHLAQRPLDRCDFRDVSEAARHPEIVAVIKLRLQEQFTEHLHRTPLVGDDLCHPGIATKSCDLHSQSADVAANKDHLPTSHGRFRGH